MIGTSAAVCLRDLTSVNNPPLCGFGVIRMSNMRPDPGGNSPNAALRAIPRAPACGCTSEGRSRIFIRGAATPIPWTSGAPAQAARQ